MERASIPYSEQIPPLVGRDVYAVRRSVSIGGHCLLRDALRHWSARVAAAVELKFHNNSKLTYERVLGPDRPASAYFTFIGDVFIVEWGKVRPNGEAALHTYLNQHLGIFNRTQTGAVVRSGHLGQVYLDGCRVAIALIDSLSVDRPLRKNEPEYSIVATLLSHGIIPVTSDGYPVRFLYV